MSRVGSARSRPLIVDVHRGRREGPRHIAHTTGVVEVDVVTATPASSPSPTPIFSSTASSTGTDDWLPVSTSTGAGPPSDTRP